jgi:hypothetical protein
MPRPLVMIHGYSSQGTAFESLRNALTSRGVNATDIDICTYVSLNNEITIKDIAEGLDRAFRNHPVLKRDDLEFDAVVHSTGMLVLRSWLTNYGAGPSSNRRLGRLKHLVGLAPATWGSPQAHKGRSWLGALVKGNRELGPDFLNAGDRVLDGLELGSRLTWELAHLDLLGDEPYYDRGPNTPFVATFIGNQPYQGLASVANDPGTDGTVRWAGCSLNTRKLKIDLTRTPIGDDGKPGERLTMLPWADERLDVPMIAVEGRNHGTLVSDSQPALVDLITKFLKVGDTGGPTYDSWLAEAKQFGEKALQAMLVNPGVGTGLTAAAKTFFGHLFDEGHGSTLEGWQQFVVHARDERGDGVSDYVIEVLKRNDQGGWEPFDEMSTDVHAYQADPSFRCFHVRLPQGLSSGDVQLRVRIHASTGTELMAYQGYGSEAKQLTATSEPVELDIETKGQGTLFFPFTTTLIEIVLNREPLPFDAESRILQFL